MLKVWHKLTKKIANSVGIGCVFEKRRGLQLGRDIFLSRRMHMISTGMKGVPLWLVLSLFPYNDESMMFFIVLSDWHNSHMYGGIRTSSSCKTSGAPSRSVLFFSETSSSLYIYSVQGVTFLLFRVQLLFSLYLTLSVRHEFRTACGLMARNYIPLCLTPARIK